MKIKFLVFVAVLNMGMANAQIAPSMQRATLTAGDRTLVDMLMRGFF